MFDIILIAYFSYRNGVRAKLKGQNAITWGIVTALSYIVFMLIGFFVVVVNFCKNDINLNQLSSLDTKGREAAAQQLMNTFSAHPLHVITMEAFGIGGYLLVRYLLERKPNKKEPEIHWMDKMGSND